MNIWCSDRISLLHKMGIHKLPNICFVSPLIRIQAHKYDLTWLFFLSLLRIYLWTPQTVSHPTLVSLWKEGEHITRGCRAAGNIQCCKEKRLRVSSKYKSSWIHSVFDPKQTFIKQRLEINFMMGWSSLLFQDLIEKYENFSISHGPK